MSRLQQINGLLLLSLFLVGSQLAPLSHYLFMVLGDAHHPMDTLAADDRGHTKHNAVDTDADLRIGTIDHRDLCSYGDLFAHFAAPHPGAVELDEPLYRPSTPHILDGWPVEESIVAHYLTRGPPRG